MCNWRRCLTALFAALAITANAGQSTDFVAMSFNIRYATFFDAGNTWLLRRTLVRDTIRKTTADVIGLQEVLKPQLAYLTKELPAFGYVGVGRDDGKTKGEYTPIFYRKARFKLINSGTFWLSDTPQRPSATYGNKVFRIATWAELQDLRNMARLMVYNTHWDYRSLPSQEKAALQINRHLASANNQRVVLMGDFNTGPNSKPMRLLQEPAGTLVDTWTVAQKKNTEVGTFHDFTGKPLTPRIDAILVRGFTSIEAGIDQVHNNRRYPSDHFPVRATLRYEQ